jgi:hypothetical protein
VDIGSLGSKEDCSAQWMKNEHLSREKNFLRDAAAFRTLFHWENYVSF